MSSPPALFDRALAHGERVAIEDEHGPTTYRELLGAAARVAAALTAGRGDLGGDRVALLVPPSCDYVAVLWGIWRAGGIAVPLALKHPLPELRYAVEETDASTIVVAPQLQPRLGPLVRSRRIVTTPEALDADPPAALPELAAAQPALILFTSGTTGRPKGVVLSHGNLQAQVTCLVDAWGWSAEDRILEVLPLHHTHGIVNVVTCALWSGAVCEMLPRFDAEEVWERLAAGRLTLFMAVPTIYVHLIRAWEAMEAPRRRRLSAAVARLRLMVSGSAALPVPVLGRWRELAGHVLLERYGMSEIGMALSNPLAGERLPGAVGRPLPGACVRLVDEDGAAVAAGEPGEIEVAGANVFRQYWRRPEATRDAFQPDGFFRTGDVAVCEDGIYRILGRRSVDIIKCGGEKISALEIESVLVTHPAIAECAVVGVEDPEWGQRVAAAVVLEPEASLDLETLRGWARERLAVYKVPTQLATLEELPRNAMGKVVKPAVVELLGAL